MRVGVLAAALLLGAACASQDRPAAGDAATVQELIGDAACRTHDQCATVGVGAKACGGPAAYLAWSTLRTDRQRLRALAESEGQAQRKQMQARGEMSDCALVPDPGAYCDQTQAAAGGLGVCRLQAAGGPKSGPAIR
jgi:hypothetical protein